MSNEKEATTETANRSPCAEQDYSAALNRLIVREMHKQGHSYQTLAARVSRQGDYFLSPEQLEIALHHDILSAGQLLQLLYALDIDSLNLNTLQQSTTADEP